MTKRGCGNHTADDLLIRFIDGETSEAESAHVEAHLAQCEGCKQRRQSLRLLSLRIESAVASTVPEASKIGRAALEQKLELRERSARRPAPRRMVWQFGWSMGIAATLAIGFMLASHTRHSVTGSHSAALESASTERFEVDGETFVALPYSNPDLPMLAPHIVQMQVPVASLTDAGVIFEPISTQASAADRSVLADVLLGLDGQPLGVHVLSTE